MGRREGRKKVKNWGRKEGKKRKRERNCIGE